MIERPKARNERAASAVEAAIAGPVILFLIFSVFSAGLMGRAMQASRYGASAGARAASIAGTDERADHDVLAAISRSAVVNNARSITKIVIFRAAGPESAVPPGCLYSGVNGLCNTYTSADLSRPESDFQTGGWPNDDFWPATSRMASRSLGSDYVGVYVQTNTDVPIGPLPKTLSDTAVTRLETTSN